MCTTKTAHQKYFISDGRGNCARVTVLTYLLSEQPSFFIGCSRWGKDESLAHTSAFATMHDYTQCRINKKPNINNKQTM
jgi:hypothetical protein